MSPLTSCASISAKVNIGKYESVDLFLSVSGIDASTTREEVEALLDGPTRQAFEAVRDRMRVRVIEIKEKHQAKKAGAGS